MNTPQFYDLLDKVHHLEHPLKAHALFEAVRDMYGVGHILYSR